MDFKFKSELFKGDSPISTHFPESDNFEELERLDWEDQTKKMYIDQTSYQVDPDTWKDDIISWLKEAEEFWYEELTSKDNLCENYANFLPDSLQLNVTEAQFSKFLYDLPGANYRITWKNFTSDDFWQKFLTHFLEWIGNEIMSDDSSIEVLEGYYQPDSILTTMGDLCELSAAIEIPDWLPKEFLEEQLTVEQIDDDNYASFLIYVSPLTLGIDFYKLDHPFKQKIEFIDPLEVLSFLEEIGMDDSESLDFLRSFLKDQKEVLKRKSEGGFYTNTYFDLWPQNIAEMEKYFFGVSGSKKVYIGIQFTAKYANIIAHFMDREEFWKIKTYPSDLDQIIFDQIGIDLKDLTELQSFQSLKKSLQPFNTFTTKS